MRWLALLLALSGCAGAPLPPAARQPTGPQPARPGAELVQSAPVETTLLQPGIAEAWQVWPQMIAAAKTSIDLAEFYASEQAPSRLTPVIDALLAALKRGVRVRFLADARFAKTYPDTLARLAAAGATVKHFDRLHAKYFIVDGADAYLGSQNFDWRSLQHIQELGVRFGEPQAVRALADIFESDWAGDRRGGAYRFPQPLEDGGALTLVASPQASLPDPNLWDLPALVRLIDSARKSVGVQLLTFGGVRELEDALSRAAARGVSVELLLSDWELRPHTLRFLRALDPRIAVRILTVPQASTGFIPFARVAHAKYCAVDGARGWVGTSNWEPDYFMRSRNVGLLFEGGAIPPQLDSLFAATWSSPYAAPFDRAREYPAPKISLRGSWHPGAASGIFTLGGGRWDFRRTTSARTGSTSPTN